MHDHNSSLAPGAVEKHTTSVQASPLAINTRAAKRKGRHQVSHAPLASLGDEHDEQGTPQPNALLHVPPLTFLHLCYSAAVVIFEVQGGSDKGLDGHRADTLPIVAALKQRGWDAEVLFYSDADRAQLTAHCLATADAFLMRVNPGSYEGFTEAAFLAMGRELHAAGDLSPPVALLSSPTMLQVLYVSMLLASGSQSHHLTSGGFILVPVSLDAERCVRQRDGAVQTGIACLIVQVFMRCNILT